MSISVGSALRMTTRAPDSLAAGTTPATGHTESLVPMASMRSQFRAARSARAMSSGTRPWPKEIVADFRMPPHVRHGGSSSPACTRASARSIGARSPHARHTTSRVVPCTSTTRAGVEPAAWCRPSTFWVMSVSSLPRRSSATSAWWPALGWARRPNVSSRLCHARLRTSLSAT